MGQASWEEKTAHLRVIAGGRASLRRVPAAMQHGGGPCLAIPVLSPRSPSPMISDRSEATKMILAAKVRKGIRWAEVAAKIGLSKEWTTAACLGQMTLDKTQAGIVGEIFELSDEAVAWLQIVPYKGSLPSAVPTDPLIYRWYEIVNVYGTTIKELIHEEFGDGIMSAIDFSMDISREPDPKGDRVHVVLSGKFLPYKSY